MSYLDICESCKAGSHTEHVDSWNHPPDDMSCGGALCTCRGECEVFGPGITPDEVFRMRYGASAT